MTINDFRKMALGLPETAEMPHFDLISFRVKGKIFATYHATLDCAMLKLSLINQSVYCVMDKKVFYPVPGGWGKKGATFVELKHVKKQVFREALQKAWAGVAPKKLVEEFAKE
jgi:hypothetical protein